MTNKISKNRRKCKTCKYRGENDKNGCDYIYITGHRRGCPVEECDKYEKGNRIHTRNTIHYSIPHEIKRY